MMDMCTVFLVLWICLEISDGQVLHVDMRPVSASFSPPLRMNRQVQLRCDVIAHPPIDVSHTGWLHEGENGYITTDRKYTVYASPPSGIAEYLTSVLTINGITEEELGAYSCEARNAAGMYVRRALNVSRDGMLAIKVTAVDETVLVEDHVTDDVTLRNSDGTGFLHFVTIALNLTSHFYNDQLSDSSTPLVQDDRPRSHGNDTTGNNTVCSSRYSSPDVTCTGSQASRSSTFCLPIWIVIWILAWNAVGYG